MEKQPEKKKKMTSRRKSNSSFLSEVIQVKDNGVTCLSSEGKKKCQPRILLYRVKISFKNEGEIKTFKDKSQENFSSVDVHYEKQ